MNTYILLCLVGLGAALHIGGPPQSADQSQDAAEVNYALANGKPIFYQIVMGSFPFRKQMTLWLGALREKGKYDGTVVVVTDKPGCVAGGLGKELLGGEKIYSDDNVDIYPGTGNGKLHILKVKTPQSVVGIKMHKSKAWANVQKAKIDHPVSSIVYTDTDVIVAEDINNWLSYEKTLEKKNRTLALFPDYGAGIDESQNLHTGVVVMFPTRKSKACIASWGQHLGEGSDDPAPIHEFKGLFDKNSTEKKHRKRRKHSLLETSSTGVDQRALLRTWECTGNGGILKMPHHYLSFPNQHQLNKGTTTLFMHITNTGQWKTIKDDTKERFFYNKLGLSKEIDFLSTGHCTTDMWDTPEYRKLNAKVAEQ